MVTILGVILIGFAAILQTSIASRLSLLQGPADLILLTFLAWALREEATGLWQWALIAGLAVGIASELPVWIPISAYMLITIFIQLLKTRLWQVPVLSLFITTILATFVMLAAQWAGAVFLGSPVDFGQAFNLVILPSMVLNLLLAFPIYALMGEVTLRVYSGREEL